MTVDMEFHDEIRDRATIRIAEYQQAVKDYHDARVFPRYFQVRDQVLREREASRPLEAGKFAKTWEGPYVVIALVRPKIYKLQTLEGEEVLRIWNSEHLMRFIC